MMFRLRTFVTLMSIGLITYSFTQSNDAPEASQELTALRADLEKLSKNTQPGSFFPEAKVPVDLNGFRNDMLKIGNLGRRDSEYRTRHEEKVATNLGGESVNIDGKEEKIYKHNQTPPYFADLVLNEQLNKAAQFQAEYLAANNLQERLHYGPQDYQGQSMVEFGDRIKFSGYSFGVEGEAVAALYSPTESPEDFMQGNTHFRPWFNIGTDVREIGIGVAQGSPGIWSAQAPGVWYTVIIAGTGK